jgi:ribA/ribD-fused uncharacterized protein
MSFSPSRSFSLSSPMPPPWMRYPQIPLGSIGWRMGYGESYLFTWGDWLASLSEPDRRGYAQVFPLPVTWRGFGYLDDEDDASHDDASQDDEARSFRGVRLWQPGGRPRYSREALIGSDALEGAVYFWKPNPGVLGPESLGQWQPTPFTVDGDDYSCTEQYMMAEKARLFEDDAACALIMAADAPKEMKALGQKVRPFESAVWDQAKYSIVLNGNYAKFTQDPQLRDYLLSTQQRVLVEASPLDVIWGIGLGADNPKAADPSTWRGRNLLGFALMEVRDEIARVWANHDRVDWTRFG